VKHLSREATGTLTTWCKRVTWDEIVRDPRDSNCVDCLREAAAYGAAAAMRCAAVEAGGSSDEELVAERDHAVAELDKLRGILGQHQLFACAGCSRLFNIDLVAFHVGLMAWCPDCAAARGRIL